MAITATLPKVRTDEEFKKKVFKACETQGLKYSELVRVLLHHYTEGNIKIDIEDHAFEKSARIALKSDKTKKVIDHFLENYDPNRKYDNVKKA